jgi:P-type Cu2+ transporter
MNDSGNMMKSPTKVDVSHNHHHEMPEARGTSPGGHEHHQEDAAGGHRGPGSHDRHAGHSVEMFRDRFWITLLLTIPTLVWSDMVRRWFGFAAPSLPGSAYIPAIFGTAVYLYGGWVFLVGGVRELRDRLPGMMTLISLAISVAFVFSVAVTVGYPGEPLWWELATLVTIMLLGHWIEMRSIFQARGALQELARLLPTPSGSSANGSRTSQFQPSEKAIWCSCDRGQAFRLTGLFEAERATSTSR